jgi:hypothetical protein
MAPTSDYATLCREVGSLGYDACAGIRKVAGYVAAKLNSTMVSGGLLACTLRLRRASALIADEMSVADAASVGVRFGDASRFARQLKRAMWHDARTFRLRLHPVRRLSLPIQSGGFSLQRLPAVRPFSNHRNQTNAHDCVRIAAFVNTAQPRSRQ